MDPVTIGLILTALGTLAAFGAWLWPRRPKGPASDPPAPPEPTPAPEPPKGLKVSIYQGVVGFPTGPEWMLFVEAANPMQRPFKVDGVGLNLEEDGRDMSWWNPDSTPPLPCVLNETDTVKCWAPLKELGQGLVKAGFEKPLQIRGYVRDSYNEKHYSGWMKARPAQWAKADKNNPVDK